MKKKFSFEINKDHVISLTKNQQKTVRGGDPTDTMGSRECPDEEVQTDNACDGSGSTGYNGCDTYGCPPNTSLMSTCSACGGPSTNGGCNTSESNCWVTKSCPSTASCNTASDCGS